MPKKNINITSSKTLTNLDKSIPNCDIFAETSALKENSSSKSNPDISKNVPKSSDRSTPTDTAESNKLIHKVRHVTDQRSAFRCNGYVRKEMFILFITST